MRKKIAWISSAATAGLLVAGLAVAASPSTGHAPAHAVLAANAASSPPVNLDNCPMLAEGYQGGCVNQLQTELNTIDNAGLPVDGIFGPQTQQAVITFQQDNGVSPADGIVGPLTKAALNNANSVPTPQPGAPLSALQICQAQGGQIPDGHGGCTHDGTVAQGKSASDCVYEATIGEVAKLAAQGLSVKAAKFLAKEGVKRVLAVVDVGEVFYCVLLAPPNK